jgi:hypothetical protein
MLTTKTDEGNRQMEGRLKLFLAAVITAGTTLLVIAISSMSIRDVMLYMTYFTMAVVGAMLKVRLPKIEGTSSLHYFVVLLALADLTYAETLTIACAGIVVQCYWRATQTPRAVQVVFNVATMALTVGTAFATAQLPAWFGLPQNELAGGIAAATAYFVTNSVLLAGVLALSTRRRFVSVWQYWFLWSFPYYAVVGLIAAVLGGPAQRTVVAVVLPAMYLIYRYYRLHVESQGAGKLVH